MPFPLGAKECSALFAVPPFREIIMKRLLIAAAVLVGAASYAQEEYTTAVDAGKEADLVLTPSEETQATLFYEGNFNGVNGLASERNTQVSDARTYDDFCIPSGATWHVTGIFGEFLANAVWTMAHWEIRSGVAVGTGGTLVVDCPGSGADRVATGRSGFGFIEYRGTATADFTLGPGPVCYHMTVAPIGDGNGRAFVSTTSGVNGVGQRIDDNTFFDSSFFGVNWG